MAAREVLAILVLILYLVVGTLVAWYSRSRLGRWSDREFFVAGGRLGGFAAAMTYAATTYSAFMIVGLVGFTYAWGVGSFGFEMAYYIATVALLVTFARRVWAEARKRGWVSPGEALADFYGNKWLAVAVGILYLFALIPYASAQLRGIGEAFAGVAGGSYLLGVALGIAVMVVWSLLAGMWSVAFTDALQGLWMLAAATGLLIWTASALAGSGFGFDDVTRTLAEEGLLGLEGYWPLHKFIAFTLPWIFFAVTNPQVVQRLYAPRDEASVRNMVRWFAVFGLYYTVVVTLIGLLARAGAELGVFEWLDPADPKNRDRVTPMLLSLANPLLSAVVFTSIVAAAVSTADSILLALASSLYRDVLRGRVSPARARILVVLVIVLVAAAMAAVAAKRTGYIVVLSVMSSLLLLPLAPVTLAAWLGSGRLAGKGGAGLAGLLLGVAVNVAAIIYYGDPLAAFASRPLGVPLAVWVLAASAAPLLAAPAVRR